MLKERYLGELILDLFNNMDTSDKRKFIKVLKNLNKRKVLKAVYTYRKKHLEEKANSQN